MFFVTNQKIKRMFNWDYSGPGIYSITLNLVERGKNTLGRIVVLERNSEGVPVKADVVLSNLGEKILAHWKRISEFTPEITPYYARIMPDHLHLLLRVTRPMKRHLGAAIAGFKTGVEKLALLSQNKPSSPVGVAPARLLADGYQDTVLLHEGQLKNLFEYYESNPLRAAIKREASALFTKVEDFALQLEGIGRGCFAAVGNRDLLKRPLIQIQCSRSYFSYSRVPKRGGGVKIEKNAKGERVIKYESEEFKAIKETIVAALEKDAAFITPAISDGERELAREVLKRGGNLITLQNKGFAPLYKPSGKAFDACAAGRLLMLAPGAWPYVAAEKPITRFAAVAMNRICQLLAGEGKAQIDYKGMMPQKIDELVKVAVRA